MAVIQVDFASKALSRIVKFTAIVPVDYLAIPGEAENQEPKPMKTLYLLNGYTGNESDWITNTRIAMYAREHQIAIIMPAGENGFYLNNEISNNYYEDFIVQELVSFTRKLFPLSHKVEDTFIGGLSMGGYGALRNGLKHGEIFGGVIGLSSALVIQDIANKTRETLQGIASYDYYVHVFGDLAQVENSDKNPEYLITQRLQEGKTIPRLYIACGSEDFLIEHNRQFIEFLKSQDVEHVYEEGPGVHDWNFWDTYIEKAIKWMGC